MVIQRAKELKPILLVETASLKSERVEPRTNAIPRTPDLLNLLEEQGANILSTPPLRNGTVALTSRGTSPSVLVGLTSYQILWLDELMQQCP